MLKSDFHLNKILRARRFALGVPPAETRLTVCRRSLHTGAGVVGFQMTTIWSFWRRTHFSELSSNFSIRNVLPYKWLFSWKCLIWYVNHLSDPRYFKWFFLVVYIVYTCIYKYFPLVDRWWIITSRCTLRYIDIKRRRSAYPKILANIVTVYAYTST